jgi:hypothetical protein
MGDWQITDKYHKIAYNCCIITETKYKKFRKKKIISKYEQHININIMDWKAYIGKSVISLKLIDLWILMMD